MSIESLKELIKKDKKLPAESSYNRYPVRFVFAELNKNTQDEIIELIDVDHDYFVDLRNELLKKDEGWITKGSFMNKLKECPSDRDSFVLGFSELIRFYSNKELEAILLSLVTDIENSSLERKNSRRIYLVCFSMKEYIQKILGEKYHKFELFNPCINEQIEYKEDAREVFFLNGDLNVGGKVPNIVKNAGEWLELWRKSAIIDFSKPMLTTSNILYSWYEKASPDNAFQIEVLHTYADMINALCDVKIPFEYKESERKMWEELFTYLIDNEGIGNINDLIKRAANIDNVSEETLIIKWIDEEDYFVKWLIKQYILCNYNDSLLAKIFSIYRPTTKEKFAEAIWLCGYEEICEHELEERNRIILTVLKYLRNLIPEGGIKDRIEKIVCEYVFNDGYQFNAIDFNLESAAGLSGIDAGDVYRLMKELFVNRLADAIVGESIVEKEFIINLFRNGIISESDIKAKYNALYVYLSADNEVEEEQSEWINNYFKEYRISRLLGKDSDTLIELMNKYNSSSMSFYNWYYQLKNQETVIKSINEGASVYVLDGVGAEYLPYIIGVLKSKNYNVRKYFYAASHLPTITDINKPYLENYTWVNEFDREVIHGAYYKTGESLRKALECLEKIISGIIVNEAGNQFIITADHGSTARSKWTKPSKQYSFADADHEGRCCKLTEKVAETNEYALYNNSESGEKWAIALKDVSLNNNPKYEGHGGATPEEVIVPVILASYKVFDDFIDYNVFGRKTNVTGLDKTVNFIIKPKPHKAMIIEENGTLSELINIEDDIWEIELSTGMQQTVTVCVDEQRFEIRIESTRSKIMEEDDGFDD